MPKPALRHDRKMLLIGCRTAAFSLGAALCSANASHAQTAATTGSALTYPTRALRMLVPAGSGGVDTVSRIVGAPLAAALGQPVVIENRPGAGTMLASELTAKAQPDGYTLLMVTNSHVINASLHKNLRYDPLNDFAEISFVTTLPYLLVVHPSVPARSVRELIALAREHPGKLYFASAGTGSGTHLAFELFVSLAKIDALHVPYKSGPRSRRDSNCKFSEKDMYEQII